MAERTDRTAQKRARALRWGILLAVLFVSTVIGLVHQFVGGAAPAGVDALCPFGGIESAYALLTSGALLPKIAASSLILLSSVLVVAVVFRRSFCGLICPLGTIQEAFGRLGRRVFGGRREVPPAIDRPARYLKYAVLGVFTIWTWAAAELVMRPYDPWATYHHLTSPEVLAEFSVGLAVLGVTVVGSLVYDRFFCKYLCPMGAFLAIFSRLGLFKVRRDSEACIDCGACDKACPVNVKVSTAAAVNDPECINCNECVNVCPAKGALQVVGPKKRALGVTAVTGIVVGMIALTVGVTTATGTFQWTTKSPAATTAAGSSFDPASINGRTSIHEIAQASGIPESVLLSKFGVPQSDAAKPMKDIKDKYGFSPEDVKAFVEAQSQTK